MSPQEMEFIFQSIKSHDHQIGELIDKMSETNGVLAETNRMMVETHRMMADTHRMMVETSRMMTATDQKISTLSEEIAALTVNVTNQGGYVIALIDAIRDHENRIRKIEGNAL